MSESPVPPPKKTQSALQRWALLCGLLISAFLVRLIAEPSPPPAAPVLPAKIGNLKSKRPGLWVVDPAGGSDSDTTSLAAALANARPGDTILLKEGLHAGPVQIFGDLTLRGASPEQTFLKASGDVVVTVKAGKVRIENLSIEQMPGTGTPAFAALQQGGGELTLSKVQLRSEKTAAILLSAGKLEAHGIEVTGDYGLQQEGGRFECEGCAFHHSRIGIFADTKDTGAELSLTGTRAFQNQLFGIQLQGKVDAKIQDSQFDSNEGTGMSVGPGVTVSGKSTSASRNRRSGLMIDGATATFEDLSVIGSGQTGVLATNQARLELQHSSISRGDKLGLFATKASQIRLERVEFADNRSGTFIGSKDGTRIETVDMVAKERSFYAPSRVQ